MELFEGTWYNYISRRRLDCTLPMPPREPSSEGACRRPHCRREVSDKENHNHNPNHKPCDEREGSHYSLTDHLIPSSRLRVRGEASRRCL